MVAATLLGLLALGACGVPSQDSATKTDAKQVPFGLLDENRGVVVGDRSGDRDVVIFLTRDGRLVRTIRKLPPPVTLDALLDVLKEGPTRAELAEGTRSSVPDDETFESVTFAGGTAIVDLSKPFTAPSTTVQVAALAQIVFTLTARPGVGQVQFTLQGAGIEIPVANGTVTSTPVSRDDYGPFAPT